MHVLIANFRTKTYVPPDSDEQFANWNFEVNFIIDLSVVYYL